MRISEENPDYKKRFLILPDGVAEQLYNWHGGQWSGVYSLASTGDHDLVSPAMIERALSELEQDRRKIKNKKDKRELGNLIGELDMVLSSPYEFSAREAGMDIEEGDYEYSPNPSYTSLPWIIGYIVVGGIIYYLIYKKKKDEKAASQPVCFVNESGVNECYSQPLTQAQIARLLQVKNSPNSSPELKSQIDKLLSQPSSSSSSSSLYGIDPTGFML